MNSGVQKRQTAFKVGIIDILRGSYIKEEGWQPNYMITESGLRISRVNIIGTILSIQKENNFSIIVIDDGSGIIQARSFEKDNQPQGLKIGDIVQIIGRPRQYGSEKYILLEIYKKVTNPAWLKLRKLELQQNWPIDKQQKQRQDTKFIEEAESPYIIDSDDKVIEQIKKLDDGFGADYEAIIKEVNDKSAVDALLKMGRIFEIKPGKLKVLE